MSDLERLELFEKLEKADGRILALEKQVQYSKVYNYLKTDAAMVLEWL